MSALATLKPVPFCFDQTDHSYTTLDGVKRPHITGMLEKTGWIDSTWYTEESSERGTMVHALTAAYDLGGLDVRSLVSPVRGFILSHVGAMQQLRPEWDSVEEAEMHPQYLFGGRPDRVGKIFKAVGVLDGKSGVVSKSHAIQTALQAILVAWRYHLPATALQRRALYWKANGRFDVRLHDKRSDFDEAFRIIKVCC